MLDFLSMHGYGIYIWSTYTITFFVFIINLFLIYHDKKKIHKILKTLHNEPQT